MKPTAGPLPVLVETRIMEWTIVLQAAMRSGLRKNCEGKVKDDGGKSQQMEGLTDFYAGRTVHLLISRQMLNVSKN
jgi:hypothetical protein